MLDWLYWQSFHPKLLTILEVKINETRQGMIIKDALLLLQHNELHKSRIIIDSIQDLGVDFLERPSNLVDLVSLEYYLDFKNFKLALICVPIAIVKLADQEDTLFCKWLVYSKGHFV